MDPDRMLAEIPNHVLLEWIEYYSLEPWDLPVQFWPSNQKATAPAPEPAAYPLADPESRRMKAEVLLAKFKAQARSPRVATA